jgi:hypothetical protein
MWFWYCEILLYIAPEYIHNLNTNTIFNHLNLLTYVEV